MDSIYSVGLPVAPSEMAAKILEKCPFLRQNLTTLPLTDFNN